MDPAQIRLISIGSSRYGKDIVLAQYLGRNVVSVNLSQIKTNQQLFDIIHYLEFPVNLAFKDIIFIFDDIDACSDIVLSRDKETKNEDNSSSVSDNSQSMIKLKILQMSAVAAVAAVNSKNYEKDKKDQEILLHKLNLSGLLNVLDEIVDTPNCVIVMTTSHPEKLDSSN